MGGGSLETRLLPRSIFSVSSSKYTRPAKFDNDLYDSICVVEKGRHTDQCACI